MVAKIGKGSSLFGALIYNNQKVENDVARILHSNKVMQDKNGEYNMQLCYQSFAPFLAANKRTEEPILHISLNPHPDDVLADEQLIAIADEYMQKMGFGQQPYLVFKHEDIERKHIHIVSVNVDENGRKINDFNNFHRSKKITKELEEKYNLHPADKLDYAEDAPRLKKIDYEAGDIKKQIAGNVKALMQSYCFTSLPEYRALLSIYNIGVEEASGEVRGKQYRGLVYSALNNEGNKTGNPIKSSSIAKSVGYAALLKKVVSSEKLIKDNRLTERIQPILDDAIHNYRNRQSFETELLRNGISVVFRENEEGRIYGATFIDHENHAVFNGSKIGKAYSANVFHTLFQNSREDEPVLSNQEAGNMENIQNGNTENVHQPLELNITAPTPEQDVSETPTEKLSANSYEQNSGNEVSSSSLSLLEQHGTDYEAEAFARRKDAETKRKKRKGRSL